MKHKPNKGISQEDQTPFAMPEDLMQRVLVLIESNQAEILASLTKDLHFSNEQLERALSASTSPHLLDVFKVLLKHPSWVRMQASMEGNDPKHSRLKMINVMQKLLDQTNIPHLDAIFASLSNQAPYIRLGFAMCIMDDNIPLFEWVKKIAPIANQPKPDEILKNALSPPNIKAFKLAKHMAPSCSVEVILERYKRFPKEFDEVWDSLPPTTQKDVLLFVNKKDLTPHGVIFAHLQHNEIHEQLSTSPVNSKPKVM